MKKLTKITMILFVIYIALGLTSCVSKKKLKESQELQTTYLLDQTEVKWVNSVQNIENKFSESTLKIVNEYLKSYIENTSTNENESTDVTVNIKAEDGKEKSATVGNTTVTSNGADISVKTSSTKAINKQIETLNSEWSQKYDILEKSIKTAEMKSEQRDYANLKRIELLESKLDKQSKETDKTSPTFWVVLGLVISAILFIAIRYFKVKIPFIG